VWLTDPTSTNTKKITDSTGKVLFRNLQAGEHTVTLQETPAGLTVTSPQTIQINANQGYDLVFTGVFAPAQITGTAKSWGTPVEGALVRVEGKDTLEVTVNSAGVFQVDSVRRGGSGNYTFTISNYTGVSFKETTLTETLASGANTLEFMGKPDPEPTWASVSLGMADTCGVSTAGEAYCWGYNDNGQLGNGTFVDSRVPVLVSGERAWASVTSGPGGFHSCGVTAFGEAYCWGRNDSGQLGDPSRPVNSSVPVLVSGGHTWTSVTGGSYHSCGVTTAGTAYCWGAENSGQLGNGGTLGDNSVTPVLVSGGHTWAAVTGGQWHSCGVTTTDVAYCWGGHLYGGLGNGTITHSSVPVRVGGNW